VEEEETVPSFRLRFRRHRWSGLSFAFGLGAAGAAGNGCKAGIHGKPRMRSVVRPPNWGHANSRNTVNGARWRSPKPILM
jgi:hypothetical protein